jgi:uncharacterized membrane protein YbhN (UPF0104 family)
MSKYIRVLGAVVLLALVAWRTDWEHVAAAFSRMRPGYFLAAVLLYLCAQVVSGLRWRLLARAQGFDGSRLRYIAYTFIGNFFNLALPTSVGGDVVRVWYLSGQAGAGPSSGRRIAALVSVLAERVNGVAVLVLLACVSAVCCPVPLPQWVLWTVAAVGAATTIGLLAAPALWALFAGYPRLATDPKVAHLRRLAEGGWSYSGQPGVLVVATLQSVVVQIFGAFTGYLVGESLGLPVPPLYYGLIIPLVALLTLVPISLNGMGLREAGFVVLLAPLGVDAGEAVTFALLLFVVGASVGLIGAGFYFWGGYPRYLRQAKQNAATDGRPPTLAVSTTLGNTNAAST